jgi:hypothetical protein
VRRDWDAVEGAIKPKSARSRPRVPIPAHDEAAGLLDAFLPHQAGGSEAEQAARQESNQPCNFDPTVALEHMPHLM